MYKAQISIYYYDDIIIVIPVGRYQFPKKILFYVGTDDRYGR